MLRSVSVREPNQQCQTHLSFHQRRDRRPLLRTDAEVTFPMTYLPAGFDAGRSLMDRPELGELFQRAGTRSSAPASMSVLALFPELWSC